MRFYLFIVFQITSLITGSVCADVQLKFGVYTSDKPTTMVKMFRPLLNELEALLTDELSEAVKIRLHVAKNYRQGIDNLVTGKVDFARMGPASYVLSKDMDMGLRLLVMESKKGRKVFNGVICVQQGSSINHIAQLHGMSFAFGNERSTIGRYLSQQLLVQNQVRAKHLLKFEYLGRHDRVGSAVGAGQYSAGALKESTYKKLKAKGIPIREIARFKNVTKPWIANSKMSDRMVTSLTKVLLSLTNPSALKGIRKAGFLPAEDKDYAIIRQSIRSNREFFL